MSRWMTASRTLSRPLWIVCLLAAVAAAQEPKPEEGFEPLFNGKDLEGWVQRGGKASYSVDDGVIVGSSVLNTPNSFLCTEKTYGDFILELEFKVDPHLNSGVQIRSQALDKDTEIKFKTAAGKERTRKIPAGRVHGYQVEIDPSDRAWTAGIYDEGRRGWLFPLDKNKAAREAFRRDEWNALRVEAKGDTIRTWLNGMAAADLKDGLTAEGFIALQVHGVGGDLERAEMKVRWRNIRLKPLK